jgi:hypothetical protein
VLAADVFAPSVGIGAIGGADVPAAQQLGVVAKGALEKLSRDPAKTPLVLGQHHPLRIWRTKTQLGFGPVAGSAVAKQ